MKNRNTSQERTKENPKSGVYARMTALLKIVIFVDRPKTATYVPVKQQDGRIMAQNTTSVLHCGAIQEYATKATGNGNFVLKIVKIIHC